MDLRKSIKLNNLSSINEDGLKTLKGGDEIIIGHNCGQCWLSSHTKQNTHNMKPSKDCGYCAYDEPIPFDIVP